MKLIETQNAVGHVICHDITIIIKDKIKETAFRKGHVVKEEDIPVLLSIGKDHLYVWEKDDTMYHEDEAAEILADACQGIGIERSKPKEGKIELTAKMNGLLEIDVERLYQINSIENMMIATRHNNMAVKKGDKLAGTRIIPLIIEKVKMDQVSHIAGKENPILKILPFVRKTVGIITTGNEVFYGRIKDTFTPVIRQKMEQYGVEVIGHKVIGDDPQKITEAIIQLKKQGVQMILCTGGMSVDPDDRTPSAIRESGAQIISYGAPVLPGAMFLLGYFKDGTPIMGLPGCVMYAKATIFDLILPRVLADVKIEKADFAMMGHGGLCLGCDICHYPNCGFGKGV
ncbi:MAG: molybdopterin-binding protein [Lachnospiraceae bacterium]|nr:molybdopterin-binding protein [Lachnospiraceae bacterium]